MAGRVFAVGGFNSSLRERTVDVYDGGRDQWSAAASMQERRSTLGAAVLADLLYAVGGFNGSIGTHTQTHTLYRVTQVWLNICQQFALLSLPRRLCFHPRLFVCLCVCKQDYTKSTEQISTEFS